MKALNAHVVGNIVFLQLESQLSQMLYHQKSVSIYWQCDMLYILVQQCYQHSLNVKGVYSVCQKTSTF